MDREQAKVLLTRIDVIQGFADGKTIQIKMNDKWEDYHDQKRMYFIDFNTEYRIKPEPRKVYIWMGSLEKNKHIRHVYDEGNHKRLTDNNMKGYWDGCWKIYGPFELED